MLETESGAEASCASRSRSSSTESSPTRRSSRARPQRGSPPAPPPHRPRASPETRAPPRPRSRRSRSASRAWRTTCATTGRTGVPREGSRPCSPGGGSSCSTSGGRTWPRMERPLRGIRLKIATRSLTGSGRGQRRRRRRVVLAVERGRRKGKSKKTIQSTHDFAFFVLFVLRESLCLLFSFSLSFFSFAVSSPSQRESKRVSCCCSPFLSFLLPSASCFLA